MDAMLGWIQGREDFRLTPEAGEPLHVMTPVVGEDLQGDVAFQRRVARAVDLPHPARAEQRDDVVGTKAVARRERHPRKRPA